MSSSLKRSLPAGIGRVLEERRSKHVLMTDSLKRSLPAKAGYPKDEGVDIKKDINE